MQKYVVMCVLLLFLISALLCGKQREGREPDSHIFVIADSTDWVVLENVLRSTFERTIRTPQLEKTFTLVVKSPDELAQYTLKKNIILISSLESQGKTATMIRDMFTDTEIFGGVQEGKYYVFTKENQWARDQLLMILVSKDLQMLKTKIEVNSDFLYAVFDDHYTSLLKQSMFEKFERKKTEKELMEKYGWMVRVQHDYFVAFEAPENNFVWLRRRYPERWLFVYWVDTQNPSFLNREWCLKTRDEIGASFYDNDRVNRDYTYVEEEEFLGRKAFVVRGLWENNEKIAGGPYKAYCFYDPDSKRVYMIDLAVFAPGQKKMPYLKQLDVIAHTFRTRSQ